MYICSCGSVFAAENMHLTDSHIVLTAADLQKMMIAGKWCTQVGGGGRVRTEREKKRVLKNFILQGL